MNTDGEQIMRIIGEANVVAISGHINPDGDAVGACCAMARCAAKMWKSVFVLLHDYSEIFDCIPGQEFRFTGDFNAICPDVFLSLDCGSKERLGKYAAVFDKSAVTINIDHHMSNDRFAQYNLIDESASSTCQILFTLISMYVPIDDETAAALYAGIVYDTGGFRHSCTSPKTHEIAAMLLGINFNHSDIYNQLMHIRSFKEARCFGAALLNVRLNGDGTIAYGSLSGEELESYGATGKDLEGIVEYMLGIRGVEAAVFAYATDAGVCKLSFRSVEIDVGTIAKNMGGGGHRFASGCNVENDVDAALESAVNAVNASLNDHRRHKRQ